MSMTELKGHNVQPPTLYKPDKGFKGLFVKMLNKEQKHFITTLSFIEARTM